MNEMKLAVADRRNYAVKTADEAKTIADTYLKENNIDSTEVSYGLPEINDRKSEAKRS